ncbi:ATP-binding protein [Halobacillus sp. H74]|uniref:ATP-binding protein n=1 Tax=Halobacillus sp. H74 TaxID=3457436 RepID=UPI003FCEE3BE
MMRTSFEANIRHPRDMKNIRKEYHPYLAKYYGNDQLLVDASISEAVWNAWEHGHNQRNDYPIQLKISFLNSRLLVRVKDQGSGFEWKPYQVTSDIKQWFPTVEDLERRGRGITLMLRVMDVIRYNDIGNECLLMKKYLFQE